MDLIKCYFFQCFLLYTKYKKFSYIQNNIIIDARIFTVVENLMIDKNKKEQIILSYLCLFIYTQGLVVVAVTAVVDLVLSQLQSHSQYMVLLY
jgi:hypothetical protein